jgi:hypothetical protein
MYYVNESVTLDHVEIMQLLVKIKKKTKIPTKDPSVCFFLDCHKIQCKHLNFNLCCKFVFFQCQKSS